MPSCYKCGKSAKVMKCVCEDCVSNEFEGTNFEYLASNIEEMALMLMCPYDIDNCCKPEGCYICGLDWLKQNRTEKEN